MALSSLQMERNLKGCHRLWQKIEVSSHPICVSFVTGDRYFQQCPKGFVIHPVHYPDTGTQGIAGMEAAQEAHS